MKKLLSISLSVLLVLTMAISVFAEEIQIPLTEEYFGANSGAAVESVIWDNGTASVNELNQFSLVLPTTCVQGDTVTLHIKGSSDSQFRVWLLASNAKTASNQWKSVDNGFSGEGEFEYFIELTCQYIDADFETAEDVNFKAASYNTQLINFKLDYVGVTYGSMADIEAAALAEVQSYIDEAETAIANGDAEAAEAAIAVIAEKGALGFASCTEKANELTKKMKSIYDEQFLAGLQEYIDIVNNAYETAKNAGTDVAAIEAAYAEAIAAADHVFDEGKANNYSQTTEKGRELRETAKEIKSMIADAEAALEEAARIAAEEEAAKAARTRTTIIMVVVAVVVIAVVAVVVVVLKKKKH